MYVLAGVVGVLFVFYAFIMLLYKHWFIKLPPFVPPSNLSPKTSFTILIPARNEAANIAGLLQSIIKQNYPSHLWELIVIDDFSTDTTPVIVSDFGKQYPNIRLAELSKILDNKQLNSYKKKAIETGISLSTNEWILTTDADCIAGKDWLATYDAYIQEKNPVFAGGPVAFTNDGTALQTFQCLDFMALQGITAAAVSAGLHAMCNGANLAYKKEVFYEVNGFRGIDNIASGDDMLLMNKIKSVYPNRMGYVFSPKAIIETLPMPTLNGFINQRIRWASKTNKYKDISVVVVLWMVLLLNMGLLVLPFTAFFQPILFAYWLLLIFLKTWIEASFAVHIAAFFSIPLYWKNVFLQLPHILYTAFAGCFGMFGKYNWKGRQVK